MTSDTPPQSSSVKTTKPGIQTGFAICSPTPCLCYHRQATKCRCWIIAFWVSTYGKT